MSVCIYVASKSRHGPMWIGYRAQGAPIISTWIDEWEPGQTESWPQLYERAVREAAGSTSLILYQQPEEVLKGALVETGAALACSVPVLYVGPYGPSELHVLHHPLVKVCSSLSEAFALAGAPGIDEAYSVAPQPSRLALYFGRICEPGHFLYRPGSCAAIRPERHELSLPWDGSLLDTGLLKNRCVPDRPDGRVHWTCGGRPVLWHAFFWWDRSGDERGNSNSGFYVRGFQLNEHRQAFEYACQQWPAIVERQHFPLKLTELKEYGAT